MKKNAVKVLILGTTMAPLIKVGGLADVMGSLPHALKKLGIDIEVLIPRYSAMKGRSFGIRKTQRSFMVPFHNKQYRCSIEELPATETAPKVILITNKIFFGYNGVYPLGNDKKTGIPYQLSRFLFFNLAVVAFLKQNSWQPDIVHLNDWHTGLIPTLLKREDVGKKTLLTIHNLAYQGIFKTTTINTLLGGTSLCNGSATINFLREGITSADAISTVSTTYAHEILTKRYGGKLHTVLASRKNELYGILNGIDNKRFNPKIDPYILKQFTPSSYKEGKQKNKEQLKKRLGLSMEDRPLIGMVSRLAEQKGFDILLPLIPSLVKHGAHLIILGTGQKAYEMALMRLSKKFPKTLSVSIAFNTKLAQQIYASSDFFLMPSRFEPSGLGQMIAMRYGTLPVVRVTGGLKDTVRDLKQGTARANGITFTHYTQRSLKQALIRSIMIYKNKPRMDKLIQNAFAEDFSWKTSAQKYKKLYTKLSQN